MTKKMLCLFVGYLIVALSPAHIAELQKMRPFRELPPHGTLMNGRLYGHFGMPNQKSPGGIAEDNLFSVDTTNPVLNQGPEYYVNGVGRFGLHHRIAHDRVWIMEAPYSLCVMKIQELPIFDLWNPNRSKEYRAKYPKAIGPLLEPESTHHSIRLQTLRMKSITSPTGGIDPKIISGFGAVPISAASCRCYVLDAETKFMTTWDCAFEWNEKETLWEPKPSAGFAKLDQWIKDLDSDVFQKRVTAAVELEKIGQLAQPALKKFAAAKPTAEGKRRAEELIEKAFKSPYMGEEDYNYEKFPSLFTEDFHFFLRKDDYYFVTESGKLYYAPLPAKGEKARAMKAIWTDAKRPISAVIEDADRGKVWLFAKDKNAGAKLDLFFEMKETVRPETFDPAKLRPVNIEGRAKMLLEYLPLIAAEKK